MTARPTIAAAEGAHPSPWAAFRVASAAVFLVSLDATVLYAAFGALRAGFPGASAADVSWVLNAYTVVYAAMLVPAGGVADAWGRKRTFLVGVGLFIAASAACGFAGSIGWLVGARAVQAVGAALLTPASLSIVLDAFPASRRAIAVSAWGAVGGLAAAVGPGLGSTLVDTIGWPWAFFLNLPIGALSLWRGAAILAEAPPAMRRRRIDFVGMGLLILAVGAITLAIVESGSAGWSRQQLALAAAAGVAGFVAFLLWVRRAGEPLVDLGLFRHRTYRAVNAATFAFGIAFAMMFLGFFAYMTAVWKYSLPRAGAAVTPGPLMVVRVATMTGRLAAAHGHRPFLGGGALLYALAGAWFLAVPGSEPSYLLAWLPGQLMTGAAVGMVLPSLAGAAVSRLPAAHYAVGSAVNQAIRQIGSVIGVALAVALIGRLPIARTDFLPLYQTQIGLALLTALLCLAVDTRPRAIIAERA